MASFTTNWDARLGWRERAAWLVVMLVLASLLTGVAHTAPAAGQTPGASCGADVALVVDSSGSIDSVELGLMKEAFDGFVDEFLPRTRTQMAVVEFDRRAKVLQDFTADPDALHDALSLLKSDRRTNWQDALLVARNLFPHRPAPDLIVFASDGRPNKVNGSTVFDRAAGLAAAVVEADAAKAAGARIVAIGIGDKLREDKLAAIASSSDDVHTTNFRGLAQTLADLADDLCPPEFRPACGADVTLVVDSSGSIDPDELGLLKDAFDGFVDAFLPDTSTHMAVVEFDRVGKVLQDYTNDKAALHDALALLKSDRRTNWQDALLVARGLMPHRPAEDVIVFASDGRPNKVNGSTAFDRRAALAAAVVEADAAKAAGARIIAIGIGDRLRENNLAAIASSRDDVHTTDFETLAGTLAQLAIDLCGSTITVKKLIDADGLEETTHDRTPAAGWTFRPETVGGSPTPESAATDAEGSVVFVIEPETPTFDASATTVDVFEAAMEGYELLDASCAGATDNGTSNGMDGVTGIVVELDDIVVCTFINAPEDLTTGG